jgi:hypothetical protein
VKSRHHSRGFPQLNFGKRTRRLDDERRIQVGTTLGGEAIHAAVGDILLNTEEQRELSNKLALRPHLVVVRQLAEAVLHNAGCFVTQCFAQLAPADVVDDSYHGGDIFTNWMDKSGFEVLQDGITTIIKVKGKVVNELTAKVDERFKKDVEVEIRVIQMREKTKLPTSSVTGGG